MTLTQSDALAIASSAKRLGVDARTLGALFELESGTDPNVWGGAGGQYRGLIQFGPGARKEVGLPSGPMTIAEQLPYVEKYFQQRGFKPGKHGPTELYRTVLVGNPGQAGTDSFGTNSDTAARRMMPGGDLYKRFSAKLNQAFNGSTAGSLPESSHQSLAGAPSSSARGGNPLAAAVVAMKGSVPKAVGAPFTEELARIDPGAAAQVAAIRALFPAGSPAAAATKSTTGDAGMPSFASGTAYIQGGWGPGGSNHYGPHFDIKGIDNAYFSREALDPFVRVDGKPLSSGTTVAGGEFGASRDGGTRQHTGWDYAFGPNAALTLTGGAQWVGSEPGSYGDAAEFRLPDGRTFRILHGKLSKA